MGSTVAIKIEGKARKPPGHARVGFSQWSRRGVPLTRFVVLESKTYRSQIIGTPRDWLSLIKLATFGKKARFGD